MKKLLLLLPIFYIIQVNAQITFQKTYGLAPGANLGSMLKTTDGGFIMTGTSSYSTTACVYVVKTDSNGVKQWAKTYGNTLGAQALHINSTADGGYIITGSATDTTGRANPYAGGYGKTLLLKIKADGTIQWTKCYGRRGEGGSHVQQTTDKGYIVIGGTADVSTDDNIYVFKTDSLGTLQWTKTIAGDGCCGDSDFPASIMQTADGNYVLLGTIFYHTSNTHVLYLAKINATTDTIQWQSALEVINPGYGNYASSFVQTPDKGFVITGECSGLSVMLVKTDSTGVYQWAKQYSLPSGTSASVIQTRDGGFAFAGNIYTTNNMFICKTNQTGVLQWAKTLGDTSTNTNRVSTVQTLLQNSNGQYILGGTTNMYNAGINDFYLLKTDTFGNSYCNGLPISLTTTVVGSCFGGANISVDTIGTESTLTFLADTGCTQNTICYNIGAIKNYNTQNSNIQIYPNPTQNNFTIETNASEKQNLQVFDVNGKMILSQSINGTTIIDVSNLNAGVYNISIANNDGVVNKRLVIVK